MIIMQPVSNDKRANIVAAKKRGESVISIKKWFDVSDSTISRIWNKFINTGSYTPIPYLGRKSDITPETDDKIRAAIKENPSVTLEDLISNLSLNLTVSGLSRRLAKMDLSLKKRRLIQMDKTDQM